MPVVNREYWTTLKALRWMGWRVVVLWECRLRNEAVIARRVSAFLNEE